MSHSSKVKRQRAFRRWAVMARRMGVAPTHENFRRWRDVQDRLAAAVADGSDTAFGEAIIWGRWHRVKGAPLPRDVALSFPNRALIPRTFAVFDAIFTKHNP